MRRAETAGLPAIQSIPVPPAVISTVTASASFKAEVVKVAFVAPASANPLTNHW